MDITQIVLLINFMLFFLEVINITIYKRKLALTYEDNPLVILVLFTVARMFIVIHICLNMVLFWMVFLGSADDLSIYILGVSMIFLNIISLLFYVKKGNVERYFLTGIGILLWIIVLMLKILE